MGGTLRNGSRKRGCCTGRSLITLDMDNCAPGSTEDWVAAIKSIGTAAVYSTRKHDPEHPRCGPSSPPTGSCSRRSTSCARMLAQTLDATMAVFDSTTFEPNG